MCQANNKLIKLRKDRVAYKVEELVRCFWVTPFEGVRLNRNEVIEALGELYECSYIDEGFFHCCRNVSIARKLRDYFKMEYKTTFRIVKVIIPYIDNVFYEGDFDSTRDSICARKIILTDEVV